MERVARSVARSVAQSVAPSFAPSVALSLKLGIDFILHQLSYLYKYKSNLENLKAQAEKLINVKKRVLDMIKFAEANGEEIENDVKQWLSTVDYLINEAFKIIEEEQPAERNRCLCPDLKTRYQLGKIARSQLKEVVLLRHKGEKFLGVSSRSIPEKMSNLINSIGDPYGFLFNDRSYFDILNAEVDKLIYARERTRRRIEAAERNGEQIYEDVRRWLGEVELFINEASMIRSEFERKANNRYCIGFCQNLRTRFLVSQKAARELKAAVKLRKGLYDRISYPIIPQNIWLTSTKVLETFDSRMSTLNDICMVLCHDFVNMIGVYGMGGIGKTTLVKQIAAKAEQDEFFDAVVFAEVTPNPDIKRIQGEIADQLGLMFHEENEYGRARRLYDRMRKEKRILVILDNIWTSIDLETLGISFGDDRMGCKVLLTSRNRDVLSNKVGSQQIFSVGVLNEEEAFSLFRKTAGVSVEDPELQSLAIDVAKACGGLPIAIVSIAMALRDKGVSAWENALRNFRRPSSSNFTGMFADVYSSMELSYNQLEGEELKSTFLLCSLMNSDDASIMDLMKYGMGLGLFKGISMLKEARDKVYSLVNELKSSCLLLHGHTTEWFSIHDVVRLVAISIASRDQHVFTLRNEAILIDWLDKDMLKSCHSISIHDSNISEFPEGLEYPQLKFFYMNVKDPFFKIPDNVFTGMTNLVVLNLTKMYLLSLPSSLDHLVSLRTLCLHQCILGDIAGVGDLKNLEILSLPDSDIKLLPKEIGQLTQLKMLDVSNCSRLKFISPNVISSLSRLEELYMGNSFVQWHFEGLNFERSNASLDELKHLSDLTSLEIHIKDAMIVPGDLFSNKLERYRIFIGDEWDWFSEYGTSRTLKIKLNTSTYLKDVIIRQLNGIEELYLDELQGVKNVLYELDGKGFPQLRRLHIQNNSSLLCIVDSMDRESCDIFPCLESLFLQNLINLEKICHGQLAAVPFRKLTMIKVENCDKLKNIFSFSIARYLPQLQTLEVIECKNMEEIFFTDSEDEINDNFELCRIRSLTLNSLPQLKSLCFQAMMFLTSWTENELTTDTWSNEIVLEDEPDTPMPLMSERVMFPKLEVLELSEINIEKIWHNQLPSISFCMQNLTHLILRGCGKLKYLFLSSMIRGFEKLQHLEICHFAILEEVINMEELVEEERKVIIFPQLKFLLIKDLEKLTRFCLGNYIEFPSLKQLEIEKCPEFGAFILKNISTNSTADEAIENMSSEEIRPFFNGKVALPSLEEMVISDMDNLKMIWHNQLSEDSFCKLKLLEINYCDNLLTIFPPTMCVKFWRLESLTVTACASLVEIFDLQGLIFEETRYMAQLKELYIHGLPKVTHIWNKDPQGMLSFPKLHIVRVSGCQNLKNIFPASIARTLVELEELEMINCGVEEIVAKVGRAEATARFSFPRVTFLKLSMLQGLRCFYPGIHTSEWLVLKKLEVYDCGNVKVLSSKFLSFQETNEESQLDVTVPQPLFMMEKVFPNLEELKLGGKVIAMIWQGLFPEPFFRRLEVLHILKDESDVFPLHSLQRFNNLRKLILSHSSYKEIFSHEEAERHARMLTQIKNLKLVELSDLKYLWKQDSKLDSILQNLETLDVWWCTNLINLVPSSASFHNLTTLEVWFCKRLINLVAFSTAKSLVRLKEIKICGCEMMTEVVANEGEVREAKITFYRLKSLTLFSLESLTSFCSGNYTFEFPSLEELFVIQCPNMNVFSRGVLSTPNLQEVQQNWAADVWCWEGDLNTTMQQLHKKVNAQSFKED